MHLKEGTSNNSSHRFQIFALKVAKTRQTALIKKITKPFSEALFKQFEQIFEECMELAEQSETPRDTRWLNEVGEWEKLKILDRRLGGYECLSKEERTLLREEGKLKFPKMGQHNLDENQLRKLTQWEKATFEERTFAMGVHLHIMCLCGNYTSEESLVILFRIVCERMGYFYAGSPERHEENARRNLAKIAAKARHRNDPKQIDKLKIHDHWLDWQKDPELYLSKAKFSKDMLDAYPTLTSQKKIEDWCRLWEKQSK